MTARCPPVSDLGGAIEGRGLDPRALPLAGGARALRDYIPARCPSTPAPESRRQSSPSRSSSAWFRARERPRADWKVGLEHEKLVLRAGTLEPVPYDGPSGVGAILRAFERYGYTPFVEDGHVIAAQKRGLTVSIEPGGQIELSGRPFADVHAVSAELDRHLEKCRAIAGELGMEFLAAGYRPWGGRRPSRGCRRGGTT